MLELNKVQELRARSARGEMTIEDMKAAVNYLRELRGKARPAATSVAAKAAKPIINTAKLLEGL